MRRLVAVLSLIAAACTAAAQAPTPAPPSAAPAAPPVTPAAAVAAPAPAPHPQQAEWLAALREQIKGREDEPATQVFKNVQTMTKTPAGRLLRIMELGYARSLGVSCDHCHEPGAWDADTKAPKRIAREMNALTSSINRELLPKVTGLSDRKPIVNCTTCHRGKTKPALDM